MSFDVIIISMIDKELKSVLFVSATLFSTIHYNFNYQLFQVTYKEYGKITLLFMKTKLECPSRMNTTGFN